MAPDAGGEVMKQHRHKWRKCTHLCAVPQGAEGDGKVKLCHMFGGVDACGNVIAKCGAKAVGKRTLREAWENEPSRVMCAACLMAMGKLERPR